jgi:hypothetical protein
MAAPIGSVNLLLPRLRETSDVLYSKLAISSMTPELSSPSNVS